MATLSLREEATALLQDLIRLDTGNPPGNETPAAELLRAYLAGNGVACELYAKVPERANLVARIPGRGAGPRLLLLSHTDTVLADAAEWTLDPWSGELRDGEVWGRGALDMKGQVAASAVAIASLVSPAHHDRALARELHVAAGLRFIEVYVDTPLEICEQRDPKGLYARARAGMLLDFTGVSAPYEPPADPDVLIRGAEEDAKAAALRVRDALEQAWAWSSG